MACGCIETYVREEIVVHAGAATGHDVGEQVGRANEKVVGHDVAQLLLIRVYVVHFFFLPSRILERTVYDKLHSVVTFTRYNRCCFRRGSFVFFEKIKRTTARTDGFENTGRNKQSIGFRFGSIADSFQTELESIADFDETRSVSSRVWCRHERRSYPLRSDY